SDARAVFPPDGRIADRRRHAFPEDRVGKLRGPRARRGQKIRSERFHVPATQTSRLRRENASDLAPNAQREITSLDETLHLQGSWQIRSPLLTPSVAR